ncbi:MAG: hypothetical protein HS111_06155 [Kofleriaceae bacterium]|nr:hypothetical protein [Kofleriaceae bacterium]MCL4223908.1 hypothetical protein [Myxococcales bacterium]
MLRPAVASLVVVLSLAGCGATTGRAPPAQEGVTALIRALEGDDPRAAYELLARATRARVSYEEFLVQWKASAAERAWTAQRLTDALAGDPDVGERAAVTYPDGKSVVLGREGKRWRLEAALVSRVRAARPRDAIRMFADAIRHNDLPGLLQTLTLRRREGLARQLEGFLAGLDRRVDGKLEEIGTNRAELRWDENGVRFRIVLYREADEWRIDDIHVHPLPQPLDEDGEDEDDDDRF